MTSPMQAMEAEIGVVRYSDWIVVDQPMIDAFAEITHDRQFIHVDPVRAAQTPFGGTVAHGFLTLSLLSRMLASTEQPHIKGRRMAVNYGFDRIRFVTPVRSGSRVRAASVLSQCEEKRPGQFQQTFDVTVEIEGVDRPALLATWLIQFFI